ncbi:MAG: hypothetical protein IT447_08655 [Phycisphaerales bacterium]|nr:hypothetical protein [Phycisphaerales bacterium]
MAGPLAIWLVPQLLMLVACAGGWVWNRIQPRPADRLALHLVVATQIVVLFLCFPMLVDRWRKGVVIAAAVGPFGLISMILAGVGWPAMLSAAVYVLLWMFALRLVMTLLVKPSIQLSAFTIFNVWLGIGPLVWYLRQEIGQSAPQSAWSPLTAGMGLIDEPFRAIPYAIPLGAGLIAGVIFLIRHRVKLK